MLLPRVPTRIIPPGYVVIKLNFNCVSVPASVQIISLFFKSVEVLTDLFFTSWTSPFSEQ